MLSHITIASTISDNFFYIIHNEEFALAIDPVDPKVCIKALDSIGVDLKLIVNTHYHWDHINGNQQMAKAFPEVKFAYPSDSSQDIAEETGIPADMTLDQNYFIIWNNSGISTVHKHNDDINITEDTLSILDTPGHTMGHISLLTLDQKSLWCGDTIFIGGAGNCKNGGNPHLLFRTFRDVLSGLPNECVIYCGHNYAVNNLKFCLSLEPDSLYVKNLIKEAEEFSGVDEFGYRRHFLTTLGIERQYNPFFRCNDPHLQKLLKTKYEKEWTKAGETSNGLCEQTFITLRALRNHW